MSGKSGHRCEPPTVDGSVIANEFIGKNGGVGWFPMRVILRLQPGVLLALLAAFPCHAKAPNFTPIAETRQSHGSKAPYAPPVTLRGIVTSFSGWKNSFFLEDATGGISIDRLENTSVAPGDEVDVSGQIRRGLFAPILESTQTKVVGHPGLPAPRRSAYEDLVGGRYDSMLIQVAGVVQSARVENVWNKDVLLVDLKVAGGIIAVHVLAFAGINAGSLVDSTVQITGVCGTIFNDRRQFVGVRLFAPDLHSIEVLTPQPAVGSVPLTPLGSLLGFSVSAQPIHRVHVKGTVTYSVGSLLYIQDADSAIRIDTAKPLNLKLGSRVDARGFVSNGAQSPRLINSVVERLGGAAEIRPIKIAASKVVAKESGFVQTPYDGLVTEVEGEILERFPGQRRQLWTVRQGSTVFQVQLNGDLPNQTIALEPGAHVRFTGICIVDDELDENTPFRILLRSPRDVEILTTPSSNKSFLLLLLIFLMVIIGSGILWLAHGRRELSAAVHQTSVALNEQCHRAAVVLATASCAIGFFSSLSWLTFGLQTQTLQALHLGMTPNGSLGLLVASGALLITKRRRAVLLNTSACAARWLVAALSALTIAEYFTTWSLGLDVMLVGKSSVLAAQLASGQVDCCRMAMASAFCLLLASSAIGLGTGRRFAGAGQVLAVAISVLSLLNLVCRLYGFETDHAAGANANMPIAMAAGLLLIGLAILLGSPDRGVMRNICANSPGGIMARRMIPVTIVCPIVIGWIRLQGQEAGLYDTRVGLAIFALCNLVTFCFLVWSSAALLNRLADSRRSVETALRDRERKLDMVFATGSIGDFTWDVDDDRLTAHSSIWKLYGEPGGDGSGPAEWFRQRQHADDAAGISASLEAAFSSRESFDIEFRVVWPDSTIRWIECRGTGVYGENGSVVQVNGLNVDITTRKLAEHRLAESEILFRELADAMPQIVWTTGPDGKTDYYNRRWFEYTGLGEGADWRECKPDTVHPADADGSIAAYDRSLRDGSPYECELRLKRADDNSYRWHLARAVPVRNNAGAIERWFGTSTDIDDFKRASSQLEALNGSLEQRVIERSFQLTESERRYRHLVESIKDYAIYMLDPEGRISTWNDGAENINGYKAEEVLGLHVSILYREEDKLEKLPERELALALSEGMHRHEGWRRRRDGAAFWASVLLTTIRGPNGEVTAFSKVVRDMTDQKQAERLLTSERERAEEANSAKSSFLAAMSHEIRTPMNAILGMADLLWETDLDRIQREYVGRFRRAGTNLLTLINDILDLSKIESGRFELEHVEFGLTELLDRTCEVMEPRATAKGIALRVQVLGGTPDRLSGDSCRLQQVMLNLIGNAVKFTDSGEIRLIVAPHSDGARGHIKFSVQDTGIGIPEDKLSAIFEDFTQAEDSITRRFGGTGLGLGICRRLVERMGGQLTVQSNYSRGSTFCFDVVLSVCESVVDLGGKEELIDLSGVRVLVIDDEAVNRMILFEMCAGWGMVPSEAGSLSQACDLLSRAKVASPYRLALLDVIMPRVKGLEALERLRSLDPHLAVILISSDDQPGNLTKSIAMGAAAYLLKPVRKKQLLAAVSKALRQTGSQPLRLSASSLSSESAHEADTVMRILVAEDSEDNRFLVKAYLGNRPYELTFVYNGREALEQFSQKRFDLVLMDVQMPIMDGLTATSFIRALERAESRDATPIVALTANALVEDIERSKSAGCDGHLSKPISKNTLLSTIESYRAIVPAEPSLA